MTGKRATINDVARHAGVSKATVSAVLNDSGAVRGATRDRVLASMELLNYRPAQFPGRATAARRDRSIAILVKEIDNPYYAEVILGARAVAEAKGYTLLVASSEGGYDAERRAVDVLRARDVDGLIVTPVLDEHADLSHFFELKRRNFPFVLLEGIRGVPASLVDVDNVDAARRATEHLISLGHVRLAHFAGPAYSMHSLERIDGTRRACSASRLIFGDDDVVAAGAHLADGYAAGLAYFRDRPAAERPTAVTCYNDLVAIGLCRALRELGLRVPDDVSVIGYDDVPVLEYLPVPLTTVRVPKTQMGETAAQLLIRHVESREALPPEKVFLEATLVERASTRPVGGAPAGPHAVVGASAGRRRAAAPASG
jgi:LacI family transcriptional regulator/LacI family repressor for deo operon, udp, cdd, tsx, nupC, and nupG